ALVPVVVVAVRAAHAEGRLEEHHRRVQHVGALAVEHLDVLEDLFDLLVATLRSDRRLVDARQHQCQKRGRHEYGRPLCACTHVASSYVVSAFRQTFARGEPTPKRGRSGAYSATADSVSPTMAASAAGSGLT